MGGQTEVTCLTIRQPIYNLPNPTSSVYPQTRNSQSPAHYAQNNHICNPPYIVPLQRISRPINHIRGLPYRPRRLLPIALRNRISHERKDLGLQRVFLGRREDDVFELFAAGELLM
jgi:hypothetical protein